MTVMTREDMLRELELLPVWQLREPLPSAMLSSTPSRPLAIVQQEAAIAEHHSADVISMVVTKLESVDIQALEIPEVSVKGVEVEEIEIITTASAAATLMTQETQAFEPLTFNHIASEDGVWLFILPQATPHADEALLMHNICKAMRIVVKPAIQIESLVDEMQIAQPKMMVVMGEAIAQAILQSTEDLTSLRSKLHQFNGVTLVVTYDLATLLQNRLDKAKAWDDLRLAMSTLQNSEL